MVGVYHLKVVAIVNFFIVSNVKARKGYEKERENQKVQSFENLSFLKKLDGIQVDVAAS